MRDRYDIAVIGSGFAGSLLAMIARQLGYAVVLLERGRHPRFAIGESSTPLCNLLLEELADRYHLPALKPLTKWGSWQKTYPAAACGLKRGFSFFHHNLRHPATPPLTHEQQLLVAASPHDEIADTHWFRADFDELLLHQAEDLGVVYIDEVRLTHFCEQENGIDLSGIRNGQTAEYSARFVVDATGPRGCLHQLLQISEKQFPGYPKTSALFGHFSGVQRLESGGHIADLTDAPYPIDDAAVHHVFDGGWIWVLHFNNGLTSAGVITTHGTTLIQDEREWHAFLQQIPALKKQFQQALPVKPLTHAPDLSYLSAQITGARWAMLPSAAGFVDPLLSTGFPLTLLGVERIARMLEQRLDDEQQSAGLREYAELTYAEFLQTSQLIAALYANTHNFAVFRALTLLYFAAASYSETVRRLQKPALATSFLLQNNPHFGPQCRRLFAKASHRIAPHQAEAFIAEVLAVIEPFDVAGLTSPYTRHRYPVDANDLLAAAAKVQSTHQEIAAMLDRSGFHATVGS
jgi:FADH2 O2-dependent halogenase